MDQSDSRPQLGVPLRLSLATTPPVTRTPRDPVGSPVFRRRPFVRDAVLDPGGARSSRVATISILPSWTGTNSASATIYPSGLTYRSPHDPCLRFGRRVAATPARLGPGLLARLWPSGTLTRKLSSALHSALPNIAEKKGSSAESVGGKPAGRLGSGSTGGSPLPPSPSLRPQFTGAERR